VHAVKRGKFALPYAALRVITTSQERRRIETSSDGIALSVD
jgi:hypothetical protein